MIFLKEAELAHPIDCPYLKDRKFTQEFFFAYDLNEREFEEFLESGWRRFGLYFFRPACENCQKCVPIRIICSQFKPTKSQRRVLRMNEKTEVRLSPPRYKDEIFEIYKKHSKIKFNQESNVTQFKESFFMAAVPSVQSEYYIDGKLMAVGFIDIAQNALSSVYFIYDPDYSSYSPGTYSIMKETEIAYELGLTYYNLGYWIKENKSMVYKGNFSPYQTYHWNNKIWQDGDVYESDDTQDIAQEEKIK